MRNLARGVTALGALLALGSAWMHGFFARPVVLGRIPGEAAPETLAGLHAAWLLGSSAIAALGVIALANLPGLGREPGAARTTAIAGAFFLAYGGWALAARGFHTHYFGFLAIGALLIAGAALAARGRAPD